MADRMTDRERSEVRRALARLQGWNTQGKNDSRISFLQFLLQRDAEANARDEKKGRYRRTR
jgi:hypothetical protein